ncbi:MAG: hypothetical protein QNJ88_13295 [Acidimicrobiia bacterium]|nr:hypothetical protein [Acidimicrobiia bacterium]
MSGRQPKRSKKGSDLIPLNEVRKRLLLFREEYVGIRAIDVDTIVGSVDRSNQFDRSFRPHLAVDRERARQISLAFPSGNFPPIKVYRVGDAFFIRDGHMRVAAAREMGVEFIDAEITELETDDTIPTDVEMIDVIHLEQHRRLLAETELAAVYPDADLRTTRPVGYGKLRESIASHGYRLIQERGELVSRRDVAGDWYERVYQPSVEALRQAGITESLSGSTEADLFLWLEQRRRSMLPARGPLTLEEIAWETTERDVLDSTEDEA